MTIHVRVASNGRMVLPASTRRRMGLVEGGAVTIEETEDGLVMRTTASAVARAQAFSRSLTEGRDDATVDHFLAERRKWQE